MSYNSPFSGNVVQPTDVSYRAVTLSSNTQLQWPINGNATDDYTARIMDVTASSAGLSLWMPPANQTSVGNDALIRNVGVNSFTVKDYNGSGVIITVAPGEAKYIYITANPDEQGTWGTVTFGAGTSSADASALAGKGLLAINSTLNQSYPVVSLVAGYTFVPGDRAQVYIWVGGAGSVTLPQASSLGNNWFFVLKNNGSGTLTVNTTGSESIDNSLTKNFNPNESAIVVCTGTSFVTIGYGVSSNFVFSALTKPVVSGSYTLTASEASNVIQSYTGTLTGNVTVTYPPVVNLYVISNQCVAGGYTLTVTTGIPGSADAVIPSGGQATVICDGTNFFNANTTQAGATALSLSDGNVGAPSLNFATETDTGVYRPGSGRWGVSVLGALVLDVNGSGISINGTGNFSGGVQGGSF